MLVLERHYWAPMPEVYDRIIIGDRPYDLRAGADRFRDTLHAYFPREARAIDRYLDMVRPCVWASSGYGLSHTSERFQMRLRAQTPIRGLFLTGQDLSVAGVVGALFGGAMTASGVLRRSILKEILREG